MNDTFVLQTPIARPVMEKAKKEAKKAGLSSLQDLVRLYLTKVAHTGVSVSLDFEEKLSAKAEAELTKEMELVEADLKNGDAKAYYSVEELMKDLS